MISSNLSIIYLLFLISKYNFFFYQNIINNIGVLDYAGGNVVHICSGVSGLATVLVIGNRKGFGQERFEPHNILVTFMGMSMLWVGW